MTGRGVCQAKRAPFSDRSPFDPPIRPFIWQCSPVFTLLMSYAMPGPPPLVAIMLIGNRASIMGEQVQ
jgi:hypothetical protein